MSKNKTAFVSAIVSLIIGIVLFIWPANALATIIIFIGALTLIDAVSYLVVALREKQLPYWITAIVLFVIGIVLFLHTPTAVAVFPILMGIYIAGGSVLRILSCMSAKESLPHKSLHLILNVVTLILGVLVMIHPFSTAAMMTKLTGLFMIIDAVAAFIYTLLK